MTLAILVCLLVIILGVVGNVNAARLSAFKGVDIWFWNIFWILAIKFTWVPLAG